MTPMTEMTSDVVPEADQPAYGLVWCNTWLLDGAESLDEMIDMLREATDELCAMKAAGVVLNEYFPARGGRACLVTRDPAVAARFGFETIEGSAETKTKKMRKTKTTKTKTTKTK